MKEFVLPINGLLNGITPEPVDSKANISLSECHNLEPTGKDYELHELVIDMDTDSYDWGNA